MISTRSVELVIDTVVCLTLAKWETVSGQFGGYLTDEHPTCVRIEGEQPPIAVGAVVNLSSPNGHANCSVLHALEVGISPIKWKRPLGYAPSGLFLPGFRVAGRVQRVRLLKATGAYRDRN